MALGKQIKVVLSLDDAGFSVKTKNAAEVVKTLEVGLGNFSKSADKLESSISGLGNDLAKFGDGLSVIQKSLQSTLEGMKKTTTGMGDLDRAQEKSAKVAKDSATTMIDSKIKALNTELDSNRKALSSRESYLAQLTKLESEYNAKALAQSIEAENIRRQKKAGSSRVAQTEQNVADGYSGSAAVIREQITAVERLIQATRQEQATRISNMASLEAERNATLQNAAAKSTLSSIATAVGRNNAAEIKRITKDSLDFQKESDRAAAKSAEDLARLKKQYADQEVRDRKEAEVQMRVEARETAAAQKRAAQEAAEEGRAQARQVALMWKGMAQMYAGAKIEKGLGASVEQADQLERQKVIVSALNLPKSEEGQLVASSEAMSKNLKFLSTLEAIQSRMSAIASIGYNNAEIIDKTLSSAVKAANNLQQLGMAHGDTQSTIRNLYGVVEMRQQTGNAEATNQTFEMMQKIITGTAGKVQTQDMETVLRRMGVGASQLSDQGMVNMAALVDQFKVAGGDGGAGGGVSTVGTAIKMMQAYATGKGLSNTAVSEFAGAGVLNEGGVDLSKDSAGILKDAKHAGFKDADLWLKDPVAAIQKIMPQIVEYTKRESQRGKFYQGRDMNDPDNEMVAVSMYLQRLGITQTAASSMIVAGDPRSKERIAHQSETINNSKGINAVDAELSKTYARDVQEVKTELNEIAQIVGTTLLPPLKAVLDVVKNVLTSMREFGKENPMATQFTAIAVAIGGALLSFNGLKSLFGVTKGSISAMVGAITGLGTASTAASSAATASITPWRSYANAMSTNMAMTEIAIGSGSMGIKSSLALVGNTVAATASFVAKSFMRMLPLVGQLLLAWDFAQLLSHVKVGGHEIGEWMGKWLADTVGLWDTAWLKIEEGWLRTKGIFSDQSKAIAENIAQQAVLAKSQRDGAEANGFGPAKKKQSKELDQLDRINSPTYDANVEAKRVADANARAAQLAEASKPKPKVEAPVTPNANANAAIIAAANGSGRGSRDPLGQALGEAEGKIKADQEKLRSIIDGAQTMDSLRKQAADIIEGKRLADDYSKDHLKKNRPGSDDSRIQQLKEDEFQRLLLQEQIKAVTFGKERAAATDKEATAAMERLTSDGVEKQTDAFRALSRELERAEVRLGAGSKGFDAWEKSKAQALYGQSRADAGNYAANLVDPTKKMAAQNEEDPRTRMEKELEEVRELEQRKFDIQMTTKRKAFETLLQFEKDNAALENGMFEGSTENTNAKVLALTKQYNQETEAEIAKHTAYIAAQAKQQELAMRTPLEKLTAEWKLMGASIESIEVKMANDFTALLSQWMTTGHANVKEFIKGILIEIANAKIKEGIADPVKSIIGTGGDYLKGLLGDAGGKKDKTDDNKGIASAAATAAANIKKLADSSDTANDGMKSVSTEGLVKMTESAVENAVTTTEATVSDATSTLSTDIMTVAIDAATTALVDFAIAAEAAAVSNSVSSAFANGGIMSSSGSLSLQKYAKGGIANSPQIALFGEGSMNEAYVPLPDGRSIPVTMKSADGKNSNETVGGNNITVQINVNQADGSSNSATTGSSSSGSEDKKVWGGMADKIKGIVLQEMVTQSRPGGILYK